MPERYLGSSAPLWVLAATLGLMAAGYRRRSSVRAGAPALGVAQTLPVVDTPAAIPAPGWKEFALRVYQNFTDHRIMTLAAGMTFYSLLSVFPALAAMVTLYGLFFDPRTLMAHVDTLSGFAPTGAVEVARDQMTRIASRGAQSLGVTFLVSLAISLWSANSAMKSVFDTLNVIYGEKEKRGFFRLNAESLAFTLAGILFALVASAAVVVLPIAFHALDLSGFSETATRIGRWPALLVVLAIALAVIYRYGPSREKARWRWISWGSAFAAALWLAASLLFSWYAANFGNFNQTYGSLGAVIGFMTWLWISAMAILLGAEVDAEAERQAAPETAAAMRRGR